MTSRWHESDRLAYNQNTTVHEQLRPNTVPETTQ